MYENLTLVSAVDVFLKYQRQRKNRTNTTINTYRSVLSSFARYCGDIPLSELTTDHVDRYAIYLEQFNFAPKTFYNKLTPIRSMVKHFYSKCVIDMRPESIDLPHVEDSEANFLTPEEQIRMALACRDGREFAIFLALTRSGVRVSELINIRSDDMYESSIIIRRGKGRKSRLTFIAADAQCAIERYHSTLSFKPEYLISGATGKKLSRQYIYEVVTRIARRAGITKKVTPHTLRHTCGTNLLMNGAKLEDVQKLLGHANPSTTLIYMHFTNDYLRGQYDKASSEMLMLY